MFKNPVFVELTSAPTWLSGRRTFWLMLGTFVLGIGMGLWPFFNAMSLDVITFVRLRFSQPLIYWVSDPVPFVFILLLLYTAIAVVTVGGYITTNPSPLWLASSISKTAIVRGYLWASFYHTRPMWIFLSLYLPLMLLWGLFLSFQLGVAICFTPNLDATTLVWCQYMGIQNQNPNSLVGEFAYHMLSSSYFYNGIANFFMFYQVVRLLWYLFLIPLAISLGIAIVLWWRKTLWATVAASILTVILVVAEFYLLGFEDAFLDVPLHWVIPLILHLVFAFGLGFLVMRLSERWVHNTH